MQKRVSIKFLSIFGEKILQRKIITIFIIQNYQKFSPQQLFRTNSQSLLKYQMIFDETFMILSP